MTWDDEIILRNLIFATLIVAIVREKQNLIPIDKWKSELSFYYKNNDSLNKWLQHIQEGIDSNFISLSETLKNPKELPDKRIVAALLLSSINMLDVDTRFYANILLLTSSYFEGWEDDVKDYIEKMIVECWKNIVKTQRFYLRSPQIYADRLLSICNNDSLKGINKAAQILIEAVNVVSISLNKETFNQLQYLATKSAN
jgi:hypothetical protein